MKCEHVCLLQVPCVAVVENMSYFEVDGVRHLPFGAGSGDRIVQDFGLPNLVRFPIVADLSAAGDGRFCRWFCHCCCAIQISTALQLGLELLLSCLCFSAQQTALLTLPASKCKHTRCRLVPCWLFLLTSHACTSAMLMLKVELWISKPSLAKSIKHAVFKACWCPVT